MFAYCKNCPVIASDETGHKPVIDDVAGEVLGEWDTGSDGWEDYLRKRPDQLRYLFGCCYYKTYGTEYTCRDYKAFTVSYLTVERTELERKLDIGALSLVGYVIGCFVPGGKLAVATKHIIGGTLAVSFGITSDALVQDTYERGFFVVDEYYIDNGKWPSRHVSRYVFEVDTGGYLTEYHVWEQSFTVLNEEYEAMNSDCYTWPWPAIY